MIVKNADPGLLGFDVNQPVSPIIAAAMKTAGYSFCIRYIPRTPALASGNLTAPEIQNILGAGLSLMAVQHCPLPGWHSSADLGKSYGEYAASYAQSIGLPAGMNIWLDLEEVAAGTPVSDTINYCNQWWQSLTDAGYSPGLYVGYNPGINSDQLYKSLKFKKYWKAYNYDNGVSVRGFCMLQQTQKTLNGITFDPNKTQKDNLGDSVIWLSPS